MDQTIYGTIEEMKTTHGKVHNYLALTVDYSFEGQVSMDMIDYVKSMIKSFEVRS